MTQRPWLSAYPPGVPADIAVDQYGSLVQLMEESFQKYAARPAYSFMGKELTFAIYANDVPDDVRATGLMDRALLAVAAAN